MMELARELGQLEEWMIDLQSGLMRSSRQVATILDLPKDYQLSSWSDLEEFCADEYRDAMTAAWQECIQHGTVLNITIEAITYDHRRIWMRIVAQAVLDETGQITTVQGALQDITSSKIAESKLLESTREFRHFADSMPHVIWTALADGTVDYINDAFTHYTGIILRNSDSWLTALHLDDIKSCQEAWHHAVGNGTSFAIERRIFNQALGTHCWHAIRAEPVHDAQGVLSKWYGIITDIHDHKMLDEKLMQLGARLDATFETMSEGFFTLSHEWRFTYLNKAAEHLLQNTNARLLGEVIWDSFPDVLSSPLGRTLKAAVASVTPCHLEYFYSPLERWFFLRIHPNDQGLSVFFQDISQQKSAALKLERTTRALRRLSRCNSALIRCESEDTLLAEICEIALEDGDHQAAFVTLQDDSFIPALHLAAYRGTSSESGIKAFRKYWSNSPSDDDCPINQSARSCAPVLMRDLADYPAAWATYMRQCELVSGICLPLRDRNETLGVLTVLHREKNITLQANVTLLMELADNLAYGLARLRAEEEQRQGQNAIVKLAAATSASSGKIFFQQLTQNMAEALGAHASFVARILPETPLTARTLAAVVDGQIVDNFDYLIEGSPCEQLSREVLCVVHDHVIQQFPASPTLASLGARAYVGHRLDNAAGEPVGLLFVLFRRQLSNKDLITSTLRIFADRAAAELEREQTQIRLRDQASLLDKAHDAIIVHDLQHRISFWNSSAQRLYGWGGLEVLGRSFLELVSHDEAQFRQAYDLTSAKGEWEGEYLCQRKDGSVLTVEGSWTLVRDELGQPQSIFTIETDISVRKRMEEELLHQARHDVLTGLPNRAYFYEHLGPAIKRSLRNNSALGLLYFDIDKFKHINDTHGHDVGDEVIRIFAARVRNTVRETDFMSRLGGDEFVLAVEQLSAQDYMEVIAGKLIVAMQEEFTVEDLSLEVSTSIGIALYEANLSVDGFVRQADQAMYRAKRAGRNCFRY